MSHFNAMELSEVAALTPKEAAKVLRISPPKIYELLQQPDFPAVRLGPRTTRIPVEALRRWMEERAEA